ncbi:MAG: hypothetical protein AAFR87_35825 [Bacteroidota bacterium]
MKNAERLKYKVPIIKDGMRMVLQEPMREIWDNKDRNEKEANHFRKSIQGFEDTSPGHRRELDLFTKVLNDTTYECINLISYFTADTMVWDYSPRYFHTDSRFLGISSYEDDLEKRKEIYDSNYASEYTKYDFQRRDLTMEEFDSLLNIWNIKRTE